jgi:hypothetical protein
MNAAEPAWLQHQRQRWMRPDAARYLRPDAARWMPASLHHYLQAPPYARKYRPDQPRVPAGNPDGGQWTEEVASPEGESEESTWSEDGSVELSAAARRGGGHHYFTRELFDSEPIPKETRKIFDDATTGPLLDRRSNKYDGEHRTYNKAVREHYNDFLSRNNLTPQQMTPDHARTLLREIQQSADPRIRNFNMKIRLREILKRGPLRARGNE